MKEKIEFIDFFVIIYAFILSSIALSGYLLSYLNFRIDAMNLFNIILIIAALIYFFHPIAIPHVSKTSLLFIAISFLASTKLLIFLFSKYPIGVSVDPAHYYFASDWILKYSNLAFIDYANAPNYYYLWHSWPLWSWYYGFEFISVFTSSVFDINILRSMQFVVGLSAFVSILCTGLIGYKVLNDWRGGIFTMLQLAAIPATFILAFDGFFANITALSIGLVLAYLSIDRVKLNRFPIFFLLITGGFLIHIHTLAFMLCSILLYKIASYSRQYKHELIGFLIASGLSFITAYLLNPLAFKKFLFEGSTVIITNANLSQSTFDGIDKLFGHNIFLAIGLAGIYFLYRDRLKSSLYPFIWFVSFGGAFIFLFLSGKMHWANRMGYFLEYPLAIACAAFYIRFADNTNTLFKNYIKNVNLVVSISIMAILLFTSVYLGTDRKDLNPAIYDAGMELSGIDNNATIAYIQYPEPAPNMNRYYISAYSEHRIAWPVMKTESLTYDNFVNFTYTNEQRIGGLRFENFDTPNYFLVMFAGSDKKYIYYLFDAKVLQNTSCQNVISNIINDNCSIYMDFIKDEDLMTISGFYDFEPGFGRWTSDSPKVMIPTIEQKGGVLRIVAGAFRPNEIGEAQVDVYLNKVLIGNFTAGKKYTTNKFKIDSSIISKPFSVITFNTSTWIPDELIRNGDRRRIGIRFSSIEFMADQVKS